MIHDLGIIMLVAAVISILCKKLKQPVVLGYIVAGILAGPYVAGSSWVNVESAETWGQVGVIFLLFTMGLEFSFKKLVKMGTTAFIGCTTIVVGMMTTGFLLGRLMGWNEMNSLFLGGMLCMSSTTIVFKALDDLGLRHQHFAGLCFGILIVEDLFAVVLMVLLASIAVEQQFDGSEMLWQVAKLGAYLLFWFVAGIMLIPSILKRMRRFLNDETMTILSLAFCLGMALLAEGAGFSSALGAFVMGSILAETIEAERIEHLMSPIKNLFGAIFFVSVGMMINPMTLGEYWFPIVLLTLAVIGGQILFASLGIVLAGQPLKVAMQSAFALTQVGEFAFIIAQFGESIGVTEKFLYPVVVAVSVITTFLTPYTIRLATPAYIWVIRRMPVSIQLLLDRWYAKGRNTIDEQDIWRSFLKKVGLVVAIYLIVIIFILTFYLQILSSYIVEGINAVLPESMAWAGRLVALVIILAVIAPFIYKLVTKHLHSAESRALWRDGSYRRASVVGLFLGRLLLSTVIIIICITQFFSLTYGFLILLGMIVALLMVFSNFTHKQSSIIERNFMNNLQARERDAGRPKLADAQVGKSSVTLGRLVINPEMPFCGRTLATSNLRQLTQCNVVGIEHDGSLNLNPGPNTLLVAGDILIVAGEESNLKQLLKDRW